jgi:hypothetical protein
LALLLVSAERCVAEVEVALVAVADKSGYSDHNCSEVEPLVLLAAESPHYFGQLLVVPQID